MSFFDLDLVFSFLHLLLYCLLFTIFFCWFVQFSLDFFSFSDSLNNGRKQKLLVIMVSSFICCRTEYRFALSIRFTDDWMNRSWKAKKISFFLFTKAFQIQVFRIQWFQSPMHTHKMIESPSSFLNSLNKKKKLWSSGISWPHVSFGPKSLHLHTHTLNEKLSFFCFFSIEMNEWFRLAYDDDDDGGQTDCSLSHTETETLTTVFPPFKRIPNKKKNLFDFIGITCVYVMLLFSFSWLNECVNVILMFTNIECEWWWCFCCWKWLPNSFCLAQSYYYYNVIL